PVVVEALKQQLRICRQLRIFLGGPQCLACSPVVKLLRSLGDDQSATGFCRHRELRRQTEVERVNGLDAESPGVLSKVPAAVGCAQQRSFGEPSHSSTLLTRGIDFTAQGL